MSIPTTDLVVADSSGNDGTNVEAAIRAFKANDVAVYSSLKGDDFDTRLKVASAVTSSVPLSDHLDKVIKMQNIVIHPVELTDTQTGELVMQARTIIIDDAGKAYHATSNVIVSRLRDLVGLLGEPSSWPGPVSVKVSRVKGTGANFFYDLRVA